MNNAGDIDTLAATRLVTKSRYRQGSYSTRAMYDDYQSFPLQPIDSRPVRTGPGWPRRRCDLRIAGKIAASAARMCACRS